MAIERADRTKDLDKQIDSMQIAKDTEASSSKETAIHIKERDVVATNRLMAITNKKMSPSRDFLVSLRKAYYQLKSRKVSKKKRKPNL